MVDCQRLLKQPISPLRLLQPNPWIPPGRLRHVTAAMWSAVFPGCATARFSSILSALLCGEYTSILTTYIHLHTSCCICAVTCNFPEWKSYTCFICPSILYLHLKMTFPSLYNFSALILQPQDIIAYQPMWVWVVVSCSYSWHIWSFFLMRPGSNTVSVSGHILGAKGQKTS